MGSVYTMTVCITSLRANRKLICRILQFVIAIAELSMHSA